MKIKIRPEHASTLEMNDWLAELRDGENAEPTGPGNASRLDQAMPSPWALAPVALATPCRPAMAMACQLALATPRPRPAMSAPCQLSALATPCRPVMAAPGQLQAVPGQKPSPGPLLQPSRPPPAPGPLPPLSRPGPLPRPRPLARPGLRPRAVIGDQLRMPVMWCEMGSCVCWYADPAALGEADTRARAIDAGWRIDALSRLACPRCQQSDPGFPGLPPGHAVRDRTSAAADPSRSPPCPATAPPAAPRCEAAMTRAALPAAIPGPAGRTWNGTTIPRPMRPMHAGRVSGKPGRYLPFPRRGLESGPGLASLRRPPGGT